MHSINIETAPCGMSRAGRSFAPKISLSGRRNKGQGGFTALSHSDLIRSLLPYAEREQGASQPRRKSLDAPLDNGTFVKPIKQCFVKNPRLMPMTRLMLTLLSGWSGQGDNIKTTIGIVAKHLGRCRRQVFRYLKDAMEEGYLYYTRTKDRIGRYTGINIRLNFGAIRFNRQYKPKNRSKSAENIDVTLKSETNKNLLFIKDSDSDLWERLEHFANSAGYVMPDT